MAHMLSKVQWPTYTNMYMFFLPFSRQKRLCHRTNLVHIMPVVYSCLRPLAPGVVSFATNWVFWWESDLSASSFSTVSFPLFTSVFSILITPFIAFAWRNLGQQRKDARFLTNNKKAYLLPRGLWALEGYAIMTNRSWPFMCAILWVYLKITFFFFFNHEMTTCFRLPQSGYE